MNNKDFDQDFDFEKEYGFDPSLVAGGDNPEDELDLDAILNGDYGEAPEETAEEAPEETYTQPEETQEEAPSADDMDDEEFYRLLAGIEQEPQENAAEPPVQPEEPAPREPEFEVTPEPAFEAEYEPEMELDFNDGPTPEEPEQTEAPAPEEPQQEPPVQRERNPRRKPRSKMREFKNVYLPTIIAGLTMILVLFFVIGSISLGIKEHKQDKQNALDASASQQNEAQRIQKEAKDLMAEADRMADGYDYEGAISKLDGFSGNVNDFPEILEKKSRYAQLQDQAYEWKDPNQITNLSFHVLIADPARAFSNETFGRKYNQNFVTTDEFSKILEQLYANNYVLVDFDSFLAKNPEGSESVFSVVPIYLPAGKKPIMITETMVNYFTYMVDGDGDGAPDSKGAGFASKLIVGSDGRIVNEMVDANGQTVTGDFDVVPILDRFIDEHPDFSYRGAKATLAVCGYDGVFGYRTDSKAAEKKGEEYHNGQVEQAKEIVKALREDGYTIASYTYDNISYGDKSATAIQSDLNSWATEVVPVLGNVDIMIYAQGSDIGGSGGYSGSKYNVLYNAGFRYFIGAASSPSAEVNNNYFRQNRLMVTGSQMAHAPSVFSNYFSSNTVMNDQRGQVPQ